MSYWYSYCPPEVVHELLVPIWSPRVVHELLVPMLSPIGTCLSVGGEAITDVQYISLIKWICINKVVISRFHLICYIVDQIENKHSTLVIT